MKQMHPAAQANVTEKKEVNHPAIATPSQEEIEKAQIDYLTAKDRIRRTRTNGMRPHPSAEKAMVDSLKAEYETKKAAYDATGKGGNVPVTDEYEMDYPVDKFLIPEVREAIISTEKARDEMVRQMKIRNEMYQKYGLPEDYHSKSEDQK